MAYRKRTLLPIGIHLSADAVHMIQLEEVDNSVEVVAKAVQHLVPATVSVGARRGSADGPGPASAELRCDAARDFVREKITTGGFRGRDAIISLPSEHLVIQHVRLAPMQPDELAAGLPAELQGKLPFPPSEAVIRHIVAGTISENGEAKQDVIVLAARRGVVEKLVTTFSKLGLTITGVGVEPCAMCYPYTFHASHGEPDPEGPPALMVVYLGPRATYVAIARGLETTFVKGVELGTDNLVEAMASARKITTDEAATMRAKWRDNTGATALQEAVDAYNGIRWNLEHIVDEIESCMRYHESLARGVRLDRIVFLGPEARDKALVRVIGAQINATCEIGNPLAAVMSTPPPGDAEPELAVAIGLGLFNAQ